MASSPGDAVTLQGLSDDPYPVLARLREREPVAWVPALDGWLVTSRALCIEVMRDAVTFTVDDPRFSTAQVVGPSMLSLDGDEHRRHRDPFAAALRMPQVRERFTDRVMAMARDLVTDLAPAGRAEVRRELAGPLAVLVVAALLELPDVEPAMLLGWYDAIVASVDRISAGGDATAAGAEAFTALDQRVSAAVDVADGLLRDAATTLTVPEIVSNVAVMMFGGIETSEGMTTSAFWHVLSTPGALEAIRHDRALVDAAIEESLRLEPAAARVDRYATRDVPLGGASIRRGDLVIVSLTAANRDPDVFPDPDRFDVFRPDARKHVTFAQGPHACIGLHLARLETRAALEAALHGWPELELAAGVTPPTGVVFRKPRSLPVRWAVSSR
ncbi:MAG TPA: cytochrome P450 [Candidatus Limnocylindrales bacterium]